MNGFAYVLPDDFDSEVFTQIYVRANEVEKVTSYTDAYENLIDKIQKKVEGIEAECCQIRYDEDHGGGAGQDFRCRKRVRRR